MTKNSKNIQPLSIYKNLAFDLPASIVVFLVATPLCLGIAMASGAPLISGLISGIIGGSLVGLLSNSPLGVSGPAAGLAVIVMTSIEELGSFEIFLSAVVIGGVIQLILSLLKAGFIGYFFPSSVIKGMLAGIGIIIILKQIPHGLGYDAVFEGDLAFAQIDGFNTLSELLNVASYISPGPTIICICSMAILIVWEMSWIRSHRILSSVPGPLVCVLVGIIFYLIFDHFPILALSSDQIVNIPVIGSWGSISKLLTFPDFSRVFDPSVISIGLTIAAVGSVETLLCVEAADKLDKFKRVTSTNRELFAQGIGNIVAGLVGGLPVTQVIVRSSSNAQSGARTKASAIIHGGWIAAGLLLFPKAMNMVPLSSLAAVLILVGYKLAKISVFKGVYALGRHEFLPFLITILGIILSDLLLGVTLGFTAALMSILWSNYKTPFYTDPDLSHPEKGIRINFPEEVSFLNKAAIMKMFSRLPDGVHVIIDASQTRLMHPDIYEIINSFKISSQFRDIEFEFIQPKVNQLTEDQDYLIQKILTRNGVKIEPDINNQLIGCK